jgi:hypothetical protein
LPLARQRGEGALERGAMACLGHETLILIKAPVANEPRLGGAQPPEEGVMSMITVMVLAALLATIGSLAAGITSMATNGEVGHQRSEQWMGWRVGFQAVALLFIVIALLA